MHKALLSWQAQHPSHLPPCCGCDFTVAFSSPACVSHRGCFHFYSKKKMIPGALATARAQCPPPTPRAVQCQVLWGCAGSSLPALALIAVTQRATFSLGWARAGSPGESELLSEAPNSPFQIQAAPLCPAGRVCDYRTGLLSEGLKTCALGYPD